MIPAAGIFQSDREGIELRQCSLHRLARRQHHLHGFMCRIRRVKKQSLKFYGLVAIGDPGQISRWRVTAAASSRAVKELLPGGSIACQELLQRVTAVLARAADIR